MDFDANSIFASILISGIGFVLLVYGKRQSRVPHMAVGLALLVYTYFVSNLALMFGIAAVLLGLLWVLVKKVGV